MYAIIEIEKYGRKNRDGRFSGSAVYIPVLSASIRYIGLSSFLLCAAFCRLLLGFRAHGRLRTCAVFPAFAVGGAFVRHGIVASFKT